MTRASGLLWPMGLLGTSFVSSFGIQELYILIRHKVEEPFPGRKPLGGHTRACIRRSDDTKDTDVATQTRSRQPLATVTNQTRPIVRLPPQPKEESATSGQTFKKESPELHPELHPEPRPATSATVPKLVEFRVAESPTTARTFKTASPQPLLPTSTLR